MIGDQAISPDRLTQLFADYKAKAINRLVAELHRQLRLVLHRCFTGRLHFSTTVCDGKVNHVKVGPERTMTTSEVVALPEKTLETPVVEQAFREGLSQLLTREYFGLLAFNVTIVAGCMTEVRSLPEEQFNSKRLGLGG